MAIILRMPEVLANATEAVLASWSITEGAAFSVGDTLAEVETEKALVDLPAEQAGILGRILAQPGDSTVVGAPIAVLLAEGETEADIDALLGGPPADVAEVEEAAPVEEVAPVVPAVPAPAASAPAVPAPAAAVPAAASEPVARAAEGRRLFASPIARLRAREHGIDLAGLVGTGPEGRITRRDVDEAISGILVAGPAPADEAPRVAAAPPAAAAPAPAAAAAPAAPAVPQGATAIPHTGMRRAIARRLTESKSSVPHFYLTTDCRVDALLELRTRINESGRAKVSVNDFVVKAVAVAFAEVPEANVTWTDTHLLRWDEVDISVAVATEGGLLTPVVRGVDSLSLGAVSDRIRGLAGRAREGRLKQADLEGGSFSVTNLGMYGTTEFQAIINPPQSGILAVGAAVPQVVVTDGEPAVATVMRCSLSADHRAVDGALAARWLAAFTRAIEEPLRILV